MANLNHQARSLEALLLLVVDGELHLGEPLAQLHLDLPPDCGHLPHVGGVTQPHLDPVLLAANTNLDPWNNYEQ